MKSLLSTGERVIGAASQQFDENARLVSNIADYGMNIQQALENARFTVHPKRGCNIVIESRVEPETLKKLSALGHKLAVEKEYSTRMGRGNVVLHDSKTGMNYGASDARADGSAEPEPPHF